MDDYAQITSISIDMSTEEAPYNRIYAKPIEKQGDVLLCEFESANYDIEQKDLKEENAQLKELLKECRNSLEEQSNVRKLYESDAEYRDRYNNKMDLLIKLDEVLK